MKQEITNEQFNELSDADKTRLWMYLEGKQYAYRTEEGWRFEKDDMGYETPYLDIGQLIELLNDIIGVFIMCTDEPHPEALYWMVVLADMNKKAKKFEAIELCDALWDAIKYVIAL